eukprot:scaffold7241_cov356-Prasinococcus_capsulatus_cf.AAC.3
MEVAAKMAPIDFRAASKKTSPCVTSRMEGTSRLFGYPQLRRDWHEGPHARTSSPESSVGVSKRRKVDALSKLSPIVVGMRR